MVLAKLDGYQSDIACGNLTLEQAWIKHLREGSRRVRIFISPNKTEGVKPFNWVATMVLVLWMQPLSTKTIRLT